MAGDLDDLHVNITTIDNFHKVYTSNPGHVPHINTTCNSSEENCTMLTVSVTQNFYNLMDEFDTGMTPIGAVEMKSKLMSRQSIQIAAGNASADFHDTDEVGNRCGEINEAALGWALSSASDKAIERYDSLGKKLVIGKDKGPYNTGPTWIWHYLSY
mmetsp:Transcript_18746/g.28783  ORF Transcript_18746/g.28783 Transcript_18746/m.28783 type:complete len:157 (+) Transcript_18746:945-1415(+)